MPITLVTGASSGIGLELAKLFAAGGDDLVLTARSEDKLNELANDLRQKHRVTATVIPSDLSKIDQVDRLCDRIEDRGLQIDTIVNNAGFGALGKLADLSVERQTDMLMVNIVALTRLTRKMLPGMVRRNSGGVLNVGSIAAYQAGPNMAVYYASKAYVLSFTEAIREELADTDLHVTCLEPGATESDFGDDSGMGKLSMFSSQTMSADVVAKAGYEGFRNNEDVVIPGWKNRLMVIGSSVLPRFATRKLIGKIQGA
ncbi:putative oxidoreductase [Roseimaritima multifibrata]|uniref:Putative oxidoreductase n=1 Tax=Roseimaritima multifibrata TaxID=1930274 RepID=A0A517MG92_9BACT|nr:SDR family oxidoreductase [Roseimaritima multifibrata]QDS93899.1 putative oxidoreductase [Roseimaritima multifibrata]